MTIETEDLFKLLIGAKVVITDCEAREHGENPGCVCNLKGTIQTIEKRYESAFVGTPTWHLKDSTKRVRLSEITLLDQKGN